MKLDRFKYACIALLTIMVISSCEQRYWYRSKVRATPLKSLKTPESKGSVDIDIYNLSPEFVSRDFERVIRMAGLQKLYKEGFSPAGKDTPDYKLSIILKVDSYYVYKPKSGLFPRMAAGHTVTSGRINTGYMREINQLLELSFRYELEHLRSGYLCWQSDDGLYFFNDERKDISRSVGMVRYALGNVR